MEDWRPWDKTDPRLIETDLRMLQSTLGRNLDPAMAGGLFESLKKAMPNISICDFSRGQTDPRLLKQAALQDEVDDLVRLHERQREFKRRTVYRRAVLAANRHNRPPPPPPELSPLAVDPSSRYQGDAANERKSRESFAKAQVAHIETLIRAARGAPEEQYDLLVHAEIEGTYRDATRKPLARPHFTDPQRNLNRLPEDTPRRLLKLIALYIDNLPDEVSEQIVRRLQKSLRQAKVVSRLRQRVENLQTDLMPGGYTQRVARLQERDYRERGDTDIVPLPTSLARKNANVQRRTRGLPYDADIALSLCEDIVAEAKNGSLTPSEYTSLNADLTYWFKMARVIETPQSIPIDNSRRAARYRPPTAIAYVDTVDKMKKARQVFLPDFGSVQNEDVNFCISGNYLRWEFMQSRERNPQGPQRAFGRPPSRML